MRKSFFKAIFVVVGVLLLGSCAGGGVTSTIDPTASSTGDTSSDALVQFLPYEVIRNNLLTRLGLNASSPAIVRLDQNRSLFGAATSPGTPRNLGFSIPRLRVWSLICDAAIREALKNNPTKYFSAADPFNAEVIGRELLGRPISQVEADAMAKIVNGQGFTNNAQRQHAIGVALCTSLEAQLQ